MNGFTLLLSVIILWCLVELGLGARSWAMERRYAHEFRVEKTTQKFASARNKLMDLARTGKIDIESETFRTFYFLTTFVMRRPDQYREISEALMQAIIRKDSSPAHNPLQDESRSWTPDVKHLVREISGAFGSLLVDYSPLFRVLLRLESFFRAISILVRLMERLRTSLTEMRRQDPFISNVIQAQEHMNQIAA